MNIKAAGELKLNDSADNSTVQLQCNGGGEDN